MDVLKAFETYINVTDTVIKEYLSEELAKKLLDEITYRFTDKLMDSKEAEDDTKKEG